MNFTTGRGRRERIPWDKRRYYARLTVEEAGDSEGERRDENAGERALALGCGRNEARGGRIGGSVRGSRGRRGLRGNSAFANTLNGNHEALQIGVSLFGAHAQDADGRGLLEQ